MQNRDGLYLNYLLIKTAFNYKHYTYHRTLPLTSGTFS